MTPQLEPLQRNGSRSSPRLCANPPDHASSSPEKKRPLQNANGRIALRGAILLPREVQTSARPVPRADSIPNVAPSTATPGRRIVSVVRSRAATTTAPQTRVRRVATLLVHGTRRSVTVPPAPP